MIEQILQGLQSQVGNDLQQKAGVSSNQLDDIMKIVGGVAAKEAGKQMLDGNIGTLMNLFSDSPNDSNSNALQSNITNGIVGSLIEKLGLSKESAGMVSTIVIPALMGLITKKNNATPANDSSPLEELFNPKGQKSGGLGGLLGGLSGLLGGK